jgi:hypothetical protein
MSVLTGTVKRVERGRELDRYFAAIFAGGDHLGVSVISELNPESPTQPR